MASSNPKQIPHIITALRSLDFSSVLDVGCGYGKYGFLIREYIDHFEYKIAIDAIEADFDDEAYQVIDTIYDDLYEGDFLGTPIFIGDHAPQREYWDLILMIDVIEHFTKEDGLTAIDEALNIGKRILISTPREPAEQHIEGKPYEDHLSKWTIKDFKGVGKWKNCSTESQIIGILTRW